MKKKKAFIIIIATILSLSFVSTSAWAGSKHHYIWGGVAIGMGAAILGSALIHHNQYYSSYVPPPVPFVSYHYYRPPLQHRNRHWRPHHSHRHDHWGPRHKNRHRHWEPRHSKRRGHR